MLCGGGDGGGRGADSDVEPIQQLPAVATFDSEEGEEKD